MNKFLELLERSVIFQGILVLLVSGTVCGLVVMGREAPKELWTLLGIIVGFFFSDKTKVNMSRDIENQIKSLKDK